MPLTKMAVSRWFLCWATFAANQLSSLAAPSEAVTCGSVVKLLNVRYPVRLHSPEVKYGAGSGQQSVTGNPDQLVPGSNWQVKGNTTIFCPRGQPVRCGQIIRLEHLETSKNLHSHNYRSPISGGQEVSIYGEGGQGDSGDHWEAVCSTTLWYQEKQVAFRHVDTRMYLEATGYEYNDPIQGHVEIAGTRSTGSQINWKTSEGVYIKPSELFEPSGRTFHRQNEHTEL